MAKLILPMKQDDIRLRANRLLFSPPTKISDNNILKKINVMGLVADLNRAFCSLHSQTSVILIPLQTSLPHANAGRQTALVILLKRKKNI